jgi:hypothetical protein
MNMTDENPILHKTRHVESSLLHNCWHPLLLDTVRRIQRRKMPKKYKQSSLCLKIKAKASKVYIFTMLHVRRGIQRDVVYLGWPIASSYMSPNAGGGGELRGLSQWVQLYTGAQINLEIIFNLCKLGSHPQHSARYLCKKGGETSWAFCHHS